jgi:hypothetical protein
MCPPGARPGAPPLRAHPSPRARPLLDRRPASAPPPWSGPRWAPSRPWRGRGEAGGMGRRGDTTGASWVAAAAGALPAPPGPQTSNLSHLPPANLVTRSWCRVTSSVRARRFTFRAPSPAPTARAPAACSYASRLASRGERGGGGARVANRRCLRLLRGAAPTPGRSLLPSFPPPTRQNWRLRYFFEADQVSAWLAAGAPVDPAAIKDFVSSESGRTGDV